MGGTVRARGQTMRRCMRAVCGLALSSAPGVVVGITDRAKTLKVIVSGYADPKARTRLPPIRASRSVVRI